MTNQYQEENNSEVVEDFNLSHKEAYLKHKNVLLFHADALDRKCFDKAFIDLTITSPPYNVGIDYNSSEDQLSYEGYLRFSYD